MVGCNVNYHKNYGSFNMGPYVKGGEKMVLQATFLGEGLPQTAWNLRTENVRLLCQGDMECLRKQRGGFDGVKPQRLLLLMRGTNISAHSVANRDFTKMTLLGQRKLCRNYLIVIFLC